VAGGDHGCDSIAVGLGLQLAGITVDSFHQDERVDVSGGGSDESIGIPAWNPISRGRDDFDGEGLFADAAILKVGVALEDVRGLVAQYAGKLCFIFKK